MSFHLYRSNRLETLAELFRQHLYEADSDLFTPVTAVVANSGMGAFLQRYIAGHSALAANLQCGFLRDFLTRSICAFLTEEEQEQWRRSQENFSTGILSWRINKLFTEKPEDYPQWSSYFHGSTPAESEKRRFELSAKLAKLFDDYSLYCHEKLIAWREGIITEHPFAAQQKLYRALSGSSEVPGREYFFDRVLRADKPLFPEMLPQKTGIFGIDTIPDLYLKILVKLSDFCDVRFFCPVPSRGFLENPEHPLLADLGSAGAEFFKSLLANNCMTGADGEESFCEVLPDSGTPNRLQQFQSDLLNDTSRSEAEKLDFPAEDDSVMLHSAHTIRRELEILHDKLLKLFRSGRYTPGDVIVMFPDINRYAPVIEAVFGCGPFANRFSVCDRAQLDSSPAAVCFLRLLTLCDNRFTAPEILEFLEFPFLMSAFQFSFTDLPELENIVLKSGIRWGYDADIHDRFCKVGFPEFTFQDGFDRQLEKFAHGGIGFSRADLLGRFIKAVRAFEDLRKALLEPRTPEDWCSFLQHGVLERFFDFRDPEYADELLELRRRIIDFGVAARKGGYDAPIHIAAVTASLNFSGAVGKQQFLRGKMTFCSLVPLRSIPAKIIAVLGLNGEDFPPSDSRDELNLLIHAHIHGAPSSSADARYLLLETLMAAREKLILSYLGKAPDKEETHEPAAPLASIIQLLTKGYSAAVTQFPLQSVAPDEETRGFSGEIPFISPDSVEPEKIETLTLQELNGILLNPVSAWWCARWQEEMEVPEDTGAEADEPLGCDPRLNAVLCRRLLELERENRDPDANRKQLLKERLLPLYGIGSECFEAVRRQVALVPEEVRQALDPEERESRTLEFRGKNCLLKSSGHYFKAGAVTLRFSKAKIEKIFPAYLEQLLRCACGEKCARRQFFVISGSNGYELDTAFQAPPVPQKEAQTRLDELLDLALKARRELLPLFCRASSVYAESRRRGKNAETAWKNAEKAFAADASDAAVASVSGSWEKIAEQKALFEELALKLYGPLFRENPPEPEKPPKPDRVKPGGFTVSKEKTSSGQAEESAAPWKLVPLKGCSILEAAAGTGKTHNLKNIVARILIARPEVEIGNIVVVTFTRAAAGELRSRIRERLEALVRGDGNDEELPELIALAGITPDEAAARARKALRDFDNAPIGTIHSFASRVLRDHGFGSRMRFNFSVVNSDRDTQELCLRDFYRRMRYSERLPEKLQQMLFAFQPMGKVSQIVSFYRANPECIPQKFPSLEPIPPEAEWNGKLPILARAVIGEALEWCRERIAQHHENENTLSNDDLIFELQKALRSQKGLQEQLRKEFPVGLIDEFQDTDRKQFEIFSDLFIDNQEGTLIVVGDPRQAIYRFRGGDIDTYFAACRKMKEKGAEIFQMNCNRRSTPALIKGFNAIFADDPAAFARAGMTLPVQTPADPDAVGLLDEKGVPVEAALTVTRISGNADAGIIRAAADIAALLNSHFYLPPDKNHPEKYPLSPDHIAVLVSNWARAERVKEELRKFNIPAVTIKGFNVFTSQEASILLNLLEAAANPESPRTRFRACAALGGTDGKMVELTPELCCSLRDLWINHSFIAMFNALTEHCFIIERFSTLADGERRIANWYQLGDLLYESCSRNRQTPRATITELRNRINENADDDHLRALRETDRGAVVIDTVFGSKGLAYPVVFLPELFDIGNSLNSNYLTGKYHDGEGRLCYDPDPEPPIMEREKRELIQENLRKFYVALTRARCYCNFTFGEAHVKRSATDWLFRRSMTDKIARMETPPETPLISGANPDPEFPKILLWKLPLAAVPKNFHFETPPVNWRRIDHETKIAEGRTFLSFSGLVRHEADQLAARFRSDHLDEAAEQDQNPVTSGTALRSEPVLQLPAGTVFGQAVHRIFELTAFRTTAEKLGVLTRRVMESFGFFDLQVQQNAAAMVGNVLQTPLGDPQEPFCLADIPEDQRMAEFEFLYETGTAFTRSAVLKRAFGYFDAKFPTGESSGAAGAEFHFDGAFFNGFIDLFFLHRGKYYIVDWKTNWLGGRYEEYSAEATAGAMRANGYCLQYLIYTAALMKYLSYRLKEPLNQALYDRVFGGVRYIFTRGTSPVHAGCGIFSDRPEWDELKAFLALIG